MLNKMHEIVYKLVLSEYMFYQKYNLWMNGHTQTEN